MKTYTLLFLMILAFVFNAKAQVETILKVSFPEMYGELMIKEGMEYNPALKFKYRELYQKLSKALSDVEGYKLGVIDKTTIQVLNYDQLKQIAKKDALDTLIVLIQQKQKEINDFMKWKEKYGADSINIAVYWQNFSDNLKQNKFDAAYPYWQILFDRYPIFHSNIYLGGERILLDKIKRTNEKKYTDSLYILYDQFAKAYPSFAGYAMGRKAYHYYLFNVEGKNLNDTLIRRRLIESYILFKEAIDKYKDKIPASVFPFALKSSLFLAQLNVEDPKKYFVTPDMFLDDYLTFSDYLSTQYNNEKDEKKKENIRKNGIDLVDEVFSKSPYSTCGKLDTIFSPKFNTIKNNVNELKKVISLLSKKNCIDLKLYEDCVIALYKIEPSTKAAQSIGQLLSYKGKFAEAANYYEEALKTVDNDELKADLYFEAAKVYNQLKQYSKAREYAQNSMKYRPNDGRPLLLIATMYAATASIVGTNDFERGAVFWAAADKVIQAKNIDPSVSDEADKLLQIYRANFPRKEEAFMYSVYEGSSYTVGGWIGETTTARFIK